MNENRSRLEGISQSLSVKAGSSARPYFAQANENGPTGEWGSGEIRIFQGEEKIGSYIRNYPAFGARTFEPFELGGRWYALYSKDYTCTRIMTLPECEDIGGEEPVSSGFCPVELFVPRYRACVTKSRASGSESESESWWFESAAEKLGAGPRSKFDELYETIVGPWKCLTIGFVAGCIWGDDSSWKLELLDLSRATEGVIRREARFGHVEIAADLPLATAVQLHRSLPHPLRVTILRQEDRDIQTGKRIDPYTDELVD